MEIGPSSPFRAFCPGVKASDGTFASFCVAIAKDCNSKPSVVLSVSPDLFKCQPFDTVLTAATGGVSKIVVDGLSEVVDSVTLGISRSNSFISEFTLYNGDKIISFTAPGAVYASGEFKISQDVIPKVPKFFEFSGQATKMISIEGVDDAVTRFVSAFQGHSTNPERALQELKSSVSQIDYGMLFNVKLNMKLKFSSLKNVSDVLPDSDAFQIGEATVYATTKRVESGSNVVKAGLYMYAGVGPGAIIKGLMRYALSFAVKILDVLPGWVPLDFDVSSLADKIKTTGNLNDFEFAFATIIPDDKALLMIRAPLIDRALGFIKIECSIGLTKANLRCIVQTNIGKKLFGAIAKTFERGALWVAKELKDIGEDIEKATGKVLAVGLNTLGDAALPIGSVFSAATISSTTSQIENGLLDIGELSEKMVGQVNAFVLENGDRIEQLGRDIIRNIESGVRAAGRYAEDVVGKAKDEVAVAETILRLSSDILSNRLACTSSVIRLSVTGRCSTCCHPMISMTSELRAAGGNPLIVAKNIVKKAGKVVDGVVDDVVSAFQNTKRSVYTKEKEGARDSISNCQVYEFWERKKVVTSFAGIKKKKIKHSHLYDAPLESCVEEVAGLALDTVNAGNGENTAYADLRSTESRMQAGLTAGEMTTATLVRHGLRCKTTLQTSQAEVYTERRSRSVRRKYTIKIGRRRQTIYRIVTENYNVERVRLPLEVICHTPRINIDGSMSSDSVVVTDDRVVLVDRTEEINAAFTESERQETDKIVASVTTNVPT